MSDPIAAQQLLTHGERRERILTAAEVIFDARGYSTASVEEIGSESGIDTATILSLFPTKYELFRECALSTTRSLLVATDPGEHEPADSRQARAVLVSTLDNLASANIRRRASNGFVRGEYRYLSDADNAELFAMLVELCQRIESPLRRLRPDLGGDDAELLSVAAVSTLASVTTHPTTLPPAKIQTLLTVSAMRLLENGSALTAPTGHFAPHIEPAWMTDQSDRGRILASGITLIHERGFNAVDLDDLAQATGIPIADVEAHYGSTADLLHDAFTKGEVALREALTAAASASPIPRDILLGLSHAYVAHYFADPKLMTVFILDAEHLPQEHRITTARLHGEFIAGWVEVLCAVRPELSPSEATFLVYAALSIVADLGRLARWQYRPEVMAKIERLVVATLIGGR